MLSCGCVTICPVTGVLGFSGRTSGGETCCAAATPRPSVKARAAALAPVLNDMSNLHGWLHAVLVDARLKVKRAGIGNGCQRDHGYPGFEQGSRRRRKCGKFQVRVRPREGLTLRDA